MSRQQRHHPYSDYGTDRGVQGRRGGRGPDQNINSGGYARGGISYGGGRGALSGPPQQRGYNDQEPPRSYGGDYGPPSNYGYSVPDPSYSAPYNAGYQSYDTPQGYGETDYAPPRSVQRPPNPYGDGGFRPSAPAPYEQGSDYEPRHEGRGGSKKALIDARVEAERPCRTLFVRNVEYSAGSARVRDMFERHGEVKKMFDILDKRGMAFITFYDIRAAQQAKEATQNTEINGRKIDVHYSLPREADLNKKCDADKDQGTLFITLKNSRAALAIDEVERRFAQYGEIKSLRPYPDHPESVFIEFYDSRACVDAHEAERNAQFRDGNLNVSFVWDLSAKDRVPDPRGPSSTREGDRGYSSPPGNRGRRGYGDDGYSRGGQGPPGGLGGLGGYDQGYSGDYGQQNREYNGPSPRQGGTHGGPPGGNNDLSRSAYGSPPADQGRLEQAQKVQQLLSALAGGGNAASAPATDPYGVSASRYPPPSQSKQQAAQPPQNAATAAIAAASSSGGTSSQQVQQLLAMLAAQNGGSGSTNSKPSTEPPAGSRDPRYRY